MLSSVDIVSLCYYSLANGEERTLNTHREEVGVNAGFVMEGGIYGCGDENLGFRGGRKESRELLLQELWGEIEIRRC
jgi:hypothetical protein